MRNESFMKFKISKASDGQYYFEIQADGNHETLATSETYRRRNKADVLKAIELIRQGVSDAQIVDDTK